MSISGTYNVTLAVLALSISQASQFLNASSWKTINPPDPSLFPGMPNGTVPVILELGREIQTGPGSIKLDFQEAKIEVPNVSRLSEQPSTPFTYKTQIFVDSGIDVIGSFFEFGLSTSNETFNPAVSSDALVVGNVTYPYAVEGKVVSNMTKLADESEPKWSLDTYKNVSSQPWLGISLLCGHHTYDYDNPVEAPKFVQGTVVLYPPYAEGGEPQTFMGVHGLHATYNFSIAGPAVCKSFVS